MTVVATARRRDRLEELAAGLPKGRVHVLPGDLVDASFRADLWERAVVLSGGIDVLFNNAGVGHYSEFAEQDPAAIRQIVELNVMALFELTQKAVTHMKARGSGQVVQISSVLGFVGIPYSAAYVASKHAVNGLVKCLRYELRGTGVRIWAACPGRTISEFSNTALGVGGDSSRMPKGEPTDRVVRAIVRGLDRPRTFLIPSWFSWASLTLGRWCPPLFDRVVVRWANRHVAGALARSRRPPWKTETQADLEEMDRLG